MGLSSGITREEALELLAVHSDIGKIMFLGNWWANKRITTTGKCQPLFQRALGDPDEEE